MVELRVVGLGRRRALAPPGPPTPQTLVDFASSPRVEVDAGGANVHEHVAQLRERLTRHRFRQDVRAVEHGGHVVHAALADVLVGLDVPDSAFHVEGALVGVARGCLEDAPHVVAPDGRRNALRPAQLR